MMPLYADQLICQQGDTFVNGTFLGFNQNMVGEFKTQDNKTIIFSLGSCNLILDDTKSDPIEEPIKPKTLY
jgi:hypothetical protein